MAGTEGVMAIYRLLREAVFDDKAVKAMTSAYEETLQHLGLSRNDRDTPAGIIRRKSRNY
jgi:hypothetical protein